MPTKNPKLKDRHSMAYRVNSACILFDQHYGYTIRVEKLYRILILWLYGYMTAKERDKILKEIPHTWKDSDTRKYIRRIIRERFYNETAEAI